jgi:hypothetical protein
MSTYGQKREAIRLTACVLHMMVVDHRRRFFPAAGAGGRGDEADPLPGALEALNGQRGSSTTL